MVSKPRVEVASDSEQGNVFWLIGACKKVLEQAGVDTAEFDATFAISKLGSGSMTYADVIAKLREYVDLIDLDNRI